MYGVEVRCKGLFKGLAPYPVELAEPFTDQTIESRIRALLRTTLHDHVAQFDFLAFLDIDLHQLVNGFFVAQSVHNCKINSPAQVDKICFGHVLNAWLVGNCSSLTLAVAVATAGFVLVVRSFAQDFYLDFLVLFLIFKKIRVKLVDVKALLDLQLVVQRYLVRNLIIFLHQV